MTKTNKNNENLVFKDVVMPTTLIKPVKNTSGKKVKNQGMLGAGVDCFKTFSRILKRHFKESKPLMPKAYQEKSIEIRTSSKKKYTELEMGDILFGATPLFSFKIYKRSLEIRTQFSIISHTLRDKIHKKLKWKDVCVFIFTDSKQETPLMNGIISDVLYNRCTKLSTVKKPKTNRWIRGSKTNLLYLNSGEMELIIYALKNIDIKKFSSNDDYLKLYESLIEKTEKNLKTAKINALDYPDYYDE